MDFLAELGHRKRRDDAIMYLEDPDDDGGAGATGVFTSLPRRPGMPLLLLLLLMLTLLADAREDDLQQRPTKSKPKPNKPKSKSAGSSPSPFPRTKNTTKNTTATLTKGKTPIAPELWPLVTSIAAPTTRAHMARAVRLLQSGRCHHVYIDVGTNIGVQVRKLYEPHRYPLAHTLPLFDAYFGPANSTTADTATTAVNTTAPSGVGRGNVCTFAFEPNPRWSSALTQLEQAYKRRGWAVVVFSGTAVYTDTFHGRDLPFYPQVTLSI